ncbi:hypothetical protein [Bacillus altitudinis]|uniref:hypothetical protein n=1 Tax=Bacillus altitudinis TaxID=293387 RepID=UPI00211603F6|nr:hypothetical protein [Bacillus altitudinis]MED1481437.1 hypothetical protein [Bacillus altitudinis]UUH74474.1 hypothetical protein NP445_00860 [Bacillus altitudinis]
MNRIKLNHLKITIDTEDEVFGTDISFKEGFNIIRARNTKGKSSTINSILYVLGLEEVLGGRNAKTMKPVLKDKLSFKGREVAIIGSKVQLEISNHRGEIITLTRWIKSQNKDEKLIRVHYGPKLSREGNFSFKDFYVHMKGAALGNAGFHTFLSSYLEWELPEVPTFEGGDRILYLQTITPLYFVEQIKGWSSFYSPISGSFGIRDLSKRAFEFLLNMDVTKNAKEREELKVIKALLSNKWSALKREVEELAVSISAAIPNLPANPITLDNLSLTVYNDDKELVSIFDRIFQLEGSIKEKENYGVVAISEVASQYEEKVKEQDLLVLQLQNEINYIRQDLLLQRNNQISMGENLKKLELDLKRNQEAEKLYKLGSDIDSSFSKGICPTCSQAVADSLLPAETSIQPLDLSENITYIKEQINTLKFGIKQSHTVIQNKQSKLAVIMEHLDNARRELRLYKSELNSNPRLPTKKELDELVRLKILINKLYDASSTFEKIETRFKVIVSEWKDYLTRQEALPKDYFSELDKKKLTYFEKEFLSLLDNFNFSSINTNEITLSYDKYTPIVSGFDIKFDSSASDNIRLIWSYVIAVYKASQNFSGNHPGLMVFDEPGQQQMAVKSQKELFKVLSQTKGQSIVGTSLEPEEIKEMTENYNLNIIDLGEDYIIKPLTQ